MKNHQLNESSQTFPGQVMHVGKISQLNTSLENSGRNFNKVLSYKAGLDVCSVGEYMKYSVADLCLLLQSC